MVHPTAKGDGPFLERPPTGKRLSGIEDVHGIALDGLAKLVCERGNSGEMLQKV